MNTIFHVLEVMRLARTLGIPRWRQWFYWLKLRIVWVVALNASELCLNSLLDVPVSVAASMDTRLPVAMSRAMAFGAKQHHFRFSDLRTIIINKRVAIGWMMTVQTETIVSVIEL